MKVNYAIVFVSDMKRSVAFYRDVLGLPLRYETSEWTEFATGGATVALHASDGSPGDGGDPKRHPPGRCRPGFGVEDLDAFHERMLAHAVPCLQEPTDVHGTRLAQYADPDGLALSVAEMKGDAA